MAQEAHAQHESGFGRFMSGIERLGKKVPPPPIMFMYLFVITAILGLIFSGASALNPATGKEVVIQNPVSVEGLTWFLGNMVKNFTGYGPFGLVLTMTLAVGLMEESGMLLAMLRDKMRNIPPSILPYAAAFIGVLANIASDSGSVIIPPIAGILYAAAGKHPVVGMIVALSGAQSGFSANLMIAGTDALLQGISNNVLNGFLGEGVFSLDVTCNWYFMIASTFMLSLSIGGASKLILEPHYGPYVKKPGSKEIPLDDITPVEKRALRHSGLAALLYLVLIAVGYFYGPLAKIGPDGSRQFLGSPLLSGLVPILFFFFSIAGITYGFSSGKFKSTRDLSNAMVAVMRTMAVFVAFCFFAAQFNGLFNWTRMGTVLAIKGADGLKAAGLVGFPMIVLFILLVSTINWIMGSGSAKWTIFAPVFIPMLMLLGYHPGFIQLIYRIGDSSTNGITPLSAYCWVVLGVLQERYDPDANIGTIIGGTFPLGYINLVCWIVLLFIWITLGIPIGPGVTPELPAELAALVIK